VIHHELVHVFPALRSAEDFRLHYRNAYAGPPLWLTEGMPRPGRRNGTRTGDLFLSDLVLNDLLPPSTVSGDTRERSSFYKIGQDLVRFLEREFGAGRGAGLYDELCGR